MHGSVGSLELLWLELLLGDTEMGKYITARSY